LEPAARPLGISVGSTGLFLGPMFALALGATIGADGGPRTLMLIEAAVAVVALAVLLPALRKPGVHEAEVSSAPGWRELREIWGDPLLQRLAAVAFLGFGVFVALTTWLQVLLEPRGVTSDQAGWLLVAMTLAGAIGAIVLPTPIAKRGAERALMRTTVFVTSACLLLLAATGSLALNAVAILPIGFLLLGALPVILELVDRHVGKAGASAATVIWLAGNAGGIVIALVVQALVHHPAAAFAVAAGAIALALAAIRGMQLTKRAGLSTGP
jgi:predicted MFS family arabinose efflux permease